MTAGVQAHALAGALSRTPDDVVSMASLVRVNGPFADAIRQAIGDAWIAGSYEAAAAASRLDAAAGGHARPATCSTART